MWLLNAIRQRLESDIFLYDTQGELVPKERVITEYKKIKSFVSASNSKVVAIKLKKDYHYMLTILACMDFGVTYIPLKHDYPMDRVKQIKEDTSFDLLITEELFQKEILTHQAQEVKSRAASDDDILYILFTSGSTGRPKGAQIKRSSYENFYNWAATYFDHLTADDHFLQISEFTFDISLVDVGLFLSKGLHLHFSDFNANIFKLAYEIETYKISATSTVPNNINMLLNDMLVDRADFSSLQTILIAGARFSWGLYEKCKKHFNGRHIYNLYGPTEFTIYSHGKKLRFNEDQDSDNHNVSIGSPVLNTKSIIYENELLLAGPQLMHGYVNDNDKTQSALIELNGETFYKSGDVAFQNERGEFFITGRNDDTIKTRGFRVNLCRRYGRTNLG